MILSLVLHVFVNLNVSQVHHLLATKLGYFVFLVSLVSLWPEFDDKYLGCTQRPQSRIWPKKAWYICYLNFVRATCIVLSPLHELELWLREKVQNLYMYVTCYEAWRLNVGGHHQIISKFETSSFICVVSSFVWLIDPLILSSDCIIQITAYINIPIWMEWSYYQQIYVFASRF